MADIYILAAGHRGWDGCLFGILRAGAAAVVGVLWAGSAMAQDMTNVAPFTNSISYNGNVLSNISTITNSTPDGYWSGDIVTNAGTITNDAAAIWQGAVLSNTSQLANYGVWLDGDVTLNTRVIRNFAGASWTGHITENRSQIFNHLGATWLGNVQAVGSGGTQYNWGNWHGDIWDNAGTVYNDGVWRGDILGNRKDIVNGLDPNYSSLWVGDVRGNSSYILNYMNGRWEGDVVDNAGDIANYADWTGDLINRGRIINFGVWTGNVIQTSTFFWAENQIVGNFDNRGRLQLIGNLDMTGLLTNSGRLQLTHNTGLQTLSVGSVLFTPTSSYEIDVTAIGGNDRIIVAGAASLGGSVQVNTSTTGGGNFDEQKSYTILSAGSLSGSFSAVTTDLAFLSPHLSYDANNVILGLRRNDVGFAATGATGNQVDVGAAVQALGANNPIYESVLWLSPAQAQSAFDQLSGEIYASAGTVLIGQSQLVRDTINDRIRAAFAGVGVGQMPVLAYDETNSANAASAAIGDVLAPADTERLAAWGSVFGSWGSTDGDGRAAELNRSTGGFVTGLDGFVIENVRLGIMTGYSHSNFRADDRASSGSSDNYHLGFYGGTQMGAFGFRSGIAYTWHKVSTVRSVAFPGFTDSLSADYDAGTTQAFGELGYRIDTLSASFEPFANLAYVNLHSDGFTEKGGAAALTSASQTTDATFTTLGVRASRDFDLGTTKATARGMIGWRHAFGDTVPTAIQAFAGSDSFVVVGAPIAKDSAVIEAGLDFAISRNATLGISYTGQFGSGARDNGAKAEFSVRF